MYAYLNMQSFPVDLRDEWGCPWTLYPGRAVKGDFYARFAAPSGQLSMVHADRLDPDDIVRESKARTQRVVESWAHVFKKVDPVLVQLPLRAQPTPVIVPTPEPLPTEYEACSVCDVEYPAPVELHHTADECVSNCEEALLEIAAGEVGQSEAETPASPEAPTEVAPSKDAPAKAKKKKVRAGSK